MKLDIQFFYQEKSLRPSYVLGRVPLAAKTLKCLNESVK